MGGFFRDLFSSEEKGADSVVFGALVSLLALVVFTGYVIYLDHTQFSPWTFSTSALTVIGAGAGGRTVRDRLSTPQAAPLPPQEPK